MLCMLLRINSCWLLVCTTHLLLLLLIILLLLLLFILFLLLLRLLLCTRGLHDMLTAWWVWQLQTPSQQLTGRLQ